MVDDESPLLRVDNWPINGETLPVAWPIDVMAGAEWNILDATGARIAVCGFDTDSKTGEFRRQSERIARAIVAMMHLLKDRGVWWKEQHDRATAERDRLRAERDAARSSFESPLGKEHGAT